ncbi:hypothetical protein DMN91_005999 [Ooceraea biroi]|uniref:Uncharacterized protein n=1 Tax=Ooceraea biroi TaxID=2015173 RepID=A0A026WQH5_OOCBI|nr:uncharacterized protein LOC105276429 [Ooceraea biroi]EZA58297.1 hypothetical protein X777_01254 [Ooceraea biroi]RLU21626.1 hypothetical protein DMN91_005999 [Ooceraea biroi]
MDCCFADQYDNLQITETYSHVSSPEMFDSDAENDVNNRNDCPLSDVDTLSATSPQKPSQAELVSKSDNHLLARVSKFLSGVPPPPKHTICQNDCSDFLQLIHENRRFFWVRSPLPSKSSGAKESATSPKQMATAEADSRSSSCQRGAPRDLTDAFNACDLPANDLDSAQLGIGSSNSDNLNARLSVPKETNKLTNVTKETIRPLATMDCLNVSDERSPLLYYSLGETEAAALIWPEAYSHKFHGIHYNRSRSIEEFENLSVKLCERYVGAETQSTCNIWFSKQLSGSTRKRNLLAKREIGQSPGKRLTHLAKRRKTFSSANLQGLSLTDRRQLIVQIKKPMHKKGKSPRQGKSPRGKSPRGKSPRSSTKKKAARRLIMDGSSPRKSKLETSKRALFQSPPTDAGPSKLLSSATGNKDTQKIKRVLFSTPRKESELEDARPTSLREESRKRKCEEELEGPRLKWPKSLSFDCTHELQNTSRTAWDRHSSSSILSKNETSFGQGRNELSDTHRKKLLWAVAEALRSKGIGMNHPKFKQYAAILARTIKRFMPDLENKNIPRKPGSTTDRMLKLAKHHVLLLVDARSVD